MVWVISHPWKTNPFSYWGFGILYIISPKPPISWNLWVILGDWFPGINYHPLDLPPKNQGCNGHNQDAINKGTWRIILFSKWLVTPIYRRHLGYIWKRSHNPIFNGVTITMVIDHYRETPIPSMYGISTYIYHKHRLSIGKYGKYNTIHGWYDNNKHDRTTHTTSPHKPSQWHTRTGNGRPITSKPTTKRRRKGAPSGTTVLKKVREIAMFGGCLI